MLQITIQKHTICLWIKDLNNNDGDGDVDITQLIFRYTLNSELEDDDEKIELPDENINVDD